MIHSSDPVFRKPDPVPPRDPAPDLEPEQAAHLERIETAPAAGESFRHLTTCRGVDLCRCPAAYVDLTVQQARTGVRA